MTLKPNYQLVVGLEIHGQINSPHKLFSLGGNSNNLDDKPNTSVTHFEFGLPGILPIVNRHPILQAIKAGLALNGHINETCFFDRKHYFYRDLPSGYQITQFFVPIIQNAYLEINTGENKKKITIKQMHIESDAGKNLNRGDYYLLDYNRVSVGLIETVTDPVMHSVEEVVTFAEEFHRILTYLNICEGSMEKGNFRVDVNISVKDLKNNIQSNRCEIKNLNSFHNIAKAINYEYNRHIEALENNEIIPQCTLSFDPVKGKTSILRFKENSNDYMHIRDNDLPPIIIDKKLMEEAKEYLKNNLLPQQYREFLMKKYQLSYREAYELTKEKENCFFFINTVDELLQKNTNDNNEKQLITTVYNIIIFNLASLSNKFNNTINQSKISQKNVIDIINFINEKIITVPSSKEILEILWINGGDVETIIKEKNLQQINDSEFIEKAVEEMLKSNEETVNRYINGEKKLLQFLIGQVMKITKGKVSHECIIEMINKKIK